MACASTTSATTFVKVLSGPIRSCLQCPLCFNLVHEATTISECLHTFCKSCIHQELDDEENDCCPICNVNLGCSPLEKLRADHQLADVCAKIFPITMKKKKKLNTDIDCEVTEPVRRKERSLSSLGIGAPPSSNPGFIRRRTKSVLRRSTTARDTTSDEEAEENKAEKGKSKRAHSQEQTSSDAESEESDEVDTLAKNEVLSEEEKADQIGREQHSPRRKLVRSSRQQQASKNGDPFKSGFSDRSRISETVNSSTSRMAVSKETKLPRMREKFDKYLINESPLAQLAEVAVEQAGAKDSRDPPKGRRAPRGRGRKREESSTPFIVGGSLSWKMMLGTIRDDPPPLEKKQKTASVEMSPSSLIKPPAMKHLSSAIKKPLNPTPVSKQFKKSMGFWFSLEAAHNQLGETSLPQIPTRFLRIKNGKLPVSSVKKYLVKKLDLQSEAEVEITCRGQPVVPNLPLEKVQGIWLATNPSSSNLLPALKELNTASQDDGNWIRFKGRSAEHCMMVLTYARHPRQVTGP